MTKLKDGTVVITELGFLQFQETGEKENHM